MLATLKPYLVIATALLAACGGDEDAPPNTPPTVGALTLTTDEDTPVSGNLVVTDAENDPVTISLKVPAHGTITRNGNMVTYTPEPNYHGSDSVEVTVSDGTDAAAGTISITVGSINDAPHGVADTFATAEDVALTLAPAQVLTNDIDVDGDTLSVTAVGGATNGTVALTGGDLVFTPAADFSGTGTFTYTVSDGTASAMGEVTVTVGGANDAPVAVDDAATTDEDVAVVITAATLVANDTDADGQTPSVTAVANATNGTVALAGTDVTFTPAADFNGTASFEYTVSDGTATDTGAVTVTVTAVNDAPVAGDDVASAESGVATDFAAATFLANDTDIDSATLTITAVGSATNGTVALAGSTITFNSTAGFVGPASFTYTVSDGALTDTATVNVDVTSPAACGDGVVASSEGCDDNDTDDGDGCSATCQLELGWTCSGAPSTCTPICGDGMVRGSEACDDGGTAATDGCGATCQAEPGWTCAGEPSACTSTCGDGVIAAGAEVCDDGNAADADGCTSQCVPGVVCDATALPGGDRFAVDATTGSCYAAFDGEMTTFADAQAACVALGGYLATVTSSGEQALVVAAQNDAENPWIGASEDGNDTDAIFRWVTGEVFGFTAFAAGQPDDDAGVGGNGECLHLVDAAGAWNDTNCDIAGFVVGRICELEVSPCGDGVVQPAKAEACDDGNTTAGDGCSATCTIEPLVAFTFTGAAGNEVTLPADFAQTTIVPAPTMARGSGVSPSASQNTFSSSGWNTTTPAALDVNDYYTFTVTPAAGVAMTLQALELDERRSNSGIRQWSVRSSLDNFATDLQVFDVPDVDTTRVDQRVDLGAAFANLTAAVEFRIYGWAAELAGGTWRIDNVELFGTTVGP